MFSTMLPAEKLRWGLLWAALVVLAAPVLADLRQVWDGRLELSHGYLVLPAFFYFVWDRRDLLQASPTRTGPWVGLPLLLCAVIMVRTGQVGGIISLSSLGLVMLAWGLVWTLGGTARVRLLLFPLAFLLFMTPLFDLITGPLHWPFQLLTAKMSAFGLRAIGMPTFLEDQYLVLPHISLRVAQACSGVGFFISIIAVGMALSYLLLKKWSHWVWLISLGLVTGLVANWLRVILIGIWSQYSTAVLHGPGHVLQAMFAAVVAYVVMFVVAWVLVRRESHQAAPRARGRTVGSSLSSGSVAAERSAVRMWHLTLGILLVTVVHQVAFAVKPVPLQAGVNILPIMAGAWQGQPGTPDMAPFRLDGADGEQFRVYHHPDGCSASVYIAYLADQTQNRELVDYRSQELHKQASPVTVPLGDGETTRINAGAYARGRALPIPVRFWYEVGGRTVASPVRAKLASLTQAFGRGSNHGALVVVSGPPRGPDEWHRCVAQGGLVSQLIPALKGRLP